MNHPMECLHPAPFGISLLGVLVVILGAIVAVRTVFSHSLNSELAHKSPPSEKAATP